MKKKCIFKVLFTIVITMTLLLSTLSISAAELITEPAPNTYNHMFDNQYLSITYDENLISPESIQFEMKLETDIARWRRWGYPNDYQWEIIWERPSSNFGWFHDESEDREYEWDLTPDRIIFKEYETRREETYRRLSFLIYIDDEDMPFGYDIYGRVARGIYGDPIAIKMSDDDVLYEVQDNQLGPYFLYPEISDPIEVDLMLRESTPWTSSKFEGKRLKVYYNSDVISEEDISYVWERQEFVEEFERQTGIGDTDDIIGWTRVGDKAPEDAEYINTTYVDDPFIYLYDKRYDHYAYYTVKIIVDESKLPEGYRLKYPYRVDMTNKVKEDFIIQLDAKATFLNVNKEVLDYRWFSTELDKNRRCEGGEIYNPSIDLTTLPDIPVPPEIPGFSYTGEWKLEDIQDSEDPIIKKRVDDNNPDSFLIGAPSSYTPIYEVDYSASSLTYFLGEGGVTNDEVFFDLGSEEPVEPTVRPNSGYVFVGWVPSLSESTEENPVYEAVYKIVPETGWIPPISLEIPKLNKNATMPIKFELEEEFDDVQLIVESPESDVEYIDLKFKNEEDKFFYIGLFRPSTEGIYTVQVLINGEVVREKMVSVYDPHDNKKIKDEIIDKEKTDKIKIDKDKKK